jgi:geranylgeranyl diphosphate synthase type I
VLGVFGNEKILGKSVLSDMREGKNTMLIYKTRQLADAEDKLKIDKLWGKKDAGTDDLESVKRIISKLKVLEWCEGESTKMIRLAKGYIKKITKDNEIALIFSQIADFVAARDK